MSIHAHNTKLLQKHYPILYNYLRKVHTSNMFQLVKTNNDSCFTVTFQKDNDCRPVYIHSRQDPIDEARRWIASRISDNCEHVIFFGFGCGYMVQALLEIKPMIKISVYEPFNELFKLIQKNVNLVNILNPLNIDVLAVAAQDKLQEEFIQQVIKNINSEIQLLALPAYNRIMPEKVKEFEERFLQLLREYRSNFEVNARIESLWTLNSLLNIKEIINSTCINSKKEEFRKKPLIIVSAGPSLEYEYDNLRYIINNNMAYVFAVGSSIYALLKKDIIPHAFCSYDPVPHNEKLFAKLKQTDFPLIFGTTIYSKGLKYYSGSKFYMVMSQDTITPYLLDIDNNNIVNDVPSIAVCILQLAHKLGCDPIIFVGQDLAFPNNRYYAEGINYGNRNEELKDKEREESFKVQSVNGSEVLTYYAWDATRKVMEFYLKQYNDRLIFNTSGVGARINGTIEMPLNEIIINYLQNNSINHAWHNDNFQNKKYDYILNKAILLYNLRDQLIHKLRIIKQYLGKLDRSRNYADKVDELFKKIKNEYDLLGSNDYYKIIIKPMIRAELFLLHNSIASDIYRQINPMLKSGLIIKHYNNLYIKISDHIKVTQVILKELIDILQNKEYGR